MYVLTGRDVEQSLPARCGSGDDIRPSHYEVSKGHKPNDAVVALSCSLTMSDV